MATSHNKYLKNRMKGPSPVRQTPKRYAHATYERKIGRRTILPDAPRRHSRCLRVADLKADPGKRSSLTPI